MAETMTDVEIQGVVASGFEPVRDAFKANFDAGLEVGASFAATVAGTPVVDIWAGQRDIARTQPWEENTIVNVFSTTKAMTAICAHILADRGALEFERPVVEYWPEFGQAGKEQITVAQVMSHQAGLAGVSKPLADHYNWEALVEALEEQAPWWEPGTANGYHALTFGYLVGEIIRRISGETVGAFFQREVATPLGADFLIGFGPEEDARCGEMISPEAGIQPPSNDTDSMLLKALGNPPFATDASNTRAWRAAQIPAANGHGNARSCARIMSALALGGEVDGVRILSPEAIDRAITEQCYRTDLVLGVPMRWGLGFMLSSPDLPLGPNPRAFGHGGAGGSLAVADLDAGVSWAYVMNRMDATTTGDRRAGSIATALYGCL